MQGKANKNIDIMLISKDHQLEGVILNLEFFNLQGCTISVLKYFELHHKGR